MGNSPGPNNFHCLTSMLVRSQNNKRNWYMTSKLSLFLEIHSYPKGRSGRHWGHSAEAKIPLNSKACIDGRWEEWLLERLLGDSCISTFPPATFKSFGCSVVHFNTKQTLGTERGTFNHFLFSSFLLFEFFYCFARITVKRFIKKQILSTLQSIETCFDCQRNIFNQRTNPTIESTYFYEFP